MTVILAVVLFLSFGYSEAWNDPPLRWARPQQSCPSWGYRRRPLYQGSPDNNHDSSSSIISSEWVVVGVSVSPKGFHVILRPAELAGNADTDDDNDVEQEHPSYLPLAVTPPDAFQDSQSATSVESLTLLQLLNGVDLAGPILPPDILGRMVVFHCYLTRDDDSVSPAALRTKVLAAVQKNLPMNTTFITAHPWFRNKVPLPLAKLERLRFSQSLDNTTEPVISVTLECNLVEEMGVVQLPMTTTLLEQITGDLGLLASSASMAAAFLGIALALRYKAPMTMMGESTMLLTKEQLVERFPLYRTKEKLQASSDRVTQSIERGFKVHLLTRALEMARKRGDVLAAAKIRSKLDDYDRLDELPTIPIQYGNEGPENDSDASSISWQDLPLQ